MRNVFRILIITIFCMCAFQPQGIAAEDVDGTRLSWSAVLEGRFEDASRRIENAAAKLEKASTVRKRFRSELGEYSTQFRQLSSLINVSQGNPHEGIILYRELRQMEKKLSEQLDELRGYQTFTEQLLAQLDSLYKEASSADLSAIPRDSIGIIKTAINDVRAARTKLQKADTALVRDTGRGDKLLTQITTTRAEMENRLIGMWRTYYITASDQVYDPDIWNNIIPSLTFWAKGLPLRLTAHLPENSEQWVSFGASSLLVFLVMALPGWLFFRSSNRLFNNHAAEGLTRSLRSSWLWVALGLTILVTWQKSSLLNTGAHIALAMGELNLAWGLRRFGQPDLGRTSPLLTVFILFALALGTGVVDVPPALLTPTSAAMLMALLFFRPGLKSNGNTPLIERVLLGFTTLIIGIALLMTVFGYSRLALVLLMFWFPAACGVQLGIGLSNIVKVLVEKLPEGGMNTIFRGLLLGFGAPLAWLLSIVLFLLWIAGISGGSYFIDNLAGWEISWGIMSLSLLKIFTAAMLFYLTRASISVAQSALDQYAQRQQRYAQSVIPSLKMFVSYGLWSILLLMLLRTFGVSLTSLTVIAGGLSVGIGFGMQNLVNNFISGIILIFGRTLREGDVIELDGTWGVIRKINIRSTQIETYQNATIFVPNSEFITNRLKNWTKNDFTLRREIKVGIAYGSDVELAERLLYEVAREHPRVARYPEPSVLFMEFGSSSLDFELRVFITDINYSLSATSDLRKAIDRKFRENGVEIAFPQLDMHVRSMPKPKASEQQASDLSATQQEEGEQTEHAQSTPPAGAASLPDDDS